MPRSLCFKALLVHPWSQEGRHYRPIPMAALMASTRHIHFSQCLMEVPTNTCPISTTDTATSPSFPPAWHKPSTEVALPLPAYDLKCRAAFFPIATWMGFPFQAIFFHAGLHSKVIPVWGALTPSAPLQTTELWSNHWASFYTKRKEDSQLPTQISIIPEQQRKSFFLKLDPKSSVVSDS